MADSSFSEEIPVAAPPVAVRSLPPLSIDYSRAPLASLLADPGTLAVVGFGSPAPAQHADPRYRHVPLEPVLAPAPYEVWRSEGVVTCGRDGEVLWSGDGDYVCGAMEFSEAAHGGLAETAEYAYRVLGRWLASAATAHVLRIWNYLDAINDGDGDAERYRDFCRGRALGMRGIFEAGFPAATAIGVRDGRRVLRVHFIAAREPGRPLENPRQVSAWRYPRQYGPSAPTFARAMHAPTAAPQLYISGTAAIVGHASHHGEDFDAQVGETLANFGSLLDAAGFDAGRRFGPDGPLKIYVRRAADALRTVQLLRERLPAATPLLLLHGDICRRELLIEIDGLQSG